MVEKKHVAFDLRYMYNGPLSVEAYYVALEEWMSHHGFNKEIKRKTEEVGKTGKDIEYHIEAWKALHHSRMVTIIIRTNFKNVKEVTVTRHGRHVRLQQAELLVQIEGYLITDYALEYTNKPLYHFARTIFDKIVWNIWYEKWDGLAVEAANSVHAHIRHHFEQYKDNLRKGRPQISP